jgi:RimJ/RimL family protein N-acetyltransferase
MTLLLETERLRLRPFETRDVEVFSRYRSDPEVARYQGWDAPFSLEQAARFVTEMQSEQPGRPGGWYQLAIEVKSTAEMIGDCAFTVLSEDHRQAEIGFTLAREHQGKGYAREAVERLLGYLFSDLRLHRVRANCDPENTASGRLLERLGMRHEGRFIESLWFKGSWVGEDWYAILDREWRAIHPDDSSGLR